MSDTNEQNLNNNNTDNTTDNTNNDTNKPQDTKPAETLSDDLVSRMELVEIGRASCRERV